jgi:Notch 1
VLNRKSLACLALMAWGVGGCDDESASPTPADAGEPDAATVCPQTGEPIRDETCDTRDNDCDGLVDEDFDTNSDVNHCGACGNRCDFGNAMTACRSGECVFSGCPEGTYDADGDPTNGCEAACANTPSAETCDGEDNDCDGLTDEDFDLEVSLDHCGECGNGCNYANGVPLCDRGACVLTACDPGFGNLDGDTANGCEAPCTPENPGPEVCDGEDNDCDGEIDEGFDLTSDGEHCGECNLRCAFANAAGACVQGDCELVGCERGFSDADGDSGNGCEARCEPTNEGVEICDDLDNDCNGVVDDGVDKETDIENCGGCGRVDEAFICRLPNANAACDVGSCRVDSCVAGFADGDGEAINGCETACVPTEDPAEICDRLDNDCNGQVDEGFDLLNSVEHCGGCDSVCETGNAEPTCDEGRCRIGACPEGAVDADLDPLNGCEYECTPTEDPAEICDGADNDCDGRVDEGFDIFTNLDHCGACDAPCAPANALPVCNNGVCDTAGCVEGWFDADGDLENGCEIECTPSDDGFEICDGQDNDCDGQVDEDFDTAVDPLNCGECGRACSFPNGRVSCAAGECAQAGCLDGWVDANANSEDGCEYRCTPTEDPTEICDSVDNDCDGTVDNGFDLAGSLDHCGACNTPCEAPNGEVACTEGVCRLQECAPGFEDIDRDPTNGCEAACNNPVEEICDGADNDCDGRADEDFDLDNDVAHCGRCGNACAVDNGQPFCNGGACDVLSCAPGFVNLDGDVETGCECALSNGGVEICDGLDNDCNGVTDDANRVVPPEDFSCLGQGVCRGVAPACRVAEWVCPYPGTYQADETLCDGLDNDCDGDRDEPFPDLGRPCADGVGVCRREGEVVCTGPAATACSVTANPDAADVEVCNGRDDDCDGDTDEGSDELVLVPAGNGVAGFFIYAYEASRTDAAGDDFGQSFLRACSKPDVLPWVNVDYATALAACEAADMTLCSDAQWGRACAGAASQAYPYGNAYAPNRCNGQDFDADAARDGDQDEAVPTGSLAQCSRDMGGGPVYDLSGNVWEWTDESLADGAARALRGGSFGNVDGGLTCQFSNATPAGSFRGNIGFRCCAAQ